MERSVLEITLWMQRIQEIYLCRQRTTAMTKTGKEYENVILQDKTGSLDAKIWDPHSMGIDEFDALDYVEVNGDVTVFNGQTQLSIKRARKISETDVDPTNYLPCTNKNIDEMMMELTKFIAGVNNPYYKQVLTKLFIDNTEFAEAFKKHSAAKSVHHGFIGGLLEHTLSVAKMCDFFAKQYPILNRDLLMTSAICHDIGKVYELSDFPMNDYTDAGQLLGHIVMGSEMLGKIMDSIPDFPTKLKNELKHCILAHHGELEYGSPKKPALIEAMALNLADNADAKIETMTELLNSNSSASSDQWLGYNRLLETNVRKTSELK